MSINNPNPRPGLVRPRPRIVVDGQPMPGCSSVSITSTNNFHGDTFNAVLVPPRSWRGPGSTAWWANQDKVRVDVQIGLVPPGAPESAATWSSMLIGIVDAIDVDAINGPVSIDGRDLTALLRDSGRGGYDVNQTSSEIVTFLAKSVGLTPVVTPTKTLVGRFFQLEHGASSLERSHNVATKWDAVVELARLEGFDAFVSGTELHFQPPADEQSDPYVIRCEVDPQTGMVRSNAENLHMRRALHIARGVKVAVKSWNAKQATVVTSEQVSLAPGVAPTEVPITSAVTTEQSVSGSASAAGIEPQQYTVIKPGLTQDQADNLARRYLAEITRHERTISGRLPGDVLLTPRVVMQVTGTNTGFDQAYYPATVQREVDESGFNMSFTAKNQSPQAAAITGSA